METAAAPVPDVLPFPPRPAPADAEKRTELTLDALKRAIAGPGEHRLFRSGKLAGLFPSRAGTSADAALAALTDGLLETVRTEAKGKLIVEWVRVTAKGVAYVHDRDSPKAVLRELRAVIGATRAGVPAWMDDARREVTAVAEKFDRQAAEMLKRLDALAERVEAALWRAEAAGLSVPDPVAKVVPWAVDALAYLDRRSAAGASGPCPLGELFRAVPGLTVPDFHAGLRRLHDVRAVRLTPGGDVPDPEYALIVGAETCSSVSR
jgi:DNA-binding PadR family transcriptional regulator